MVLTARDRGARWRSADAQVPATCWLGPQDARRVRLILVGVGGHHALAGSLVARAMVQAQDTGTRRRMIVTHGVDRRACERSAPTTDAGVTLDRNFVDFDAPLPNNREYASIHAPLIHTHLDGPVRHDADAALADRRATLLAQGTDLPSVAGRGQYRFADGLAFGGLAPVAVRATLDPFFRELMGPPSQAGTADTGELEILTIESGGSHWGRIERIPGAPPGSLASWLASWAAPAKVITATLCVGTFGPDAGLECLRDDAIVRLRTDRHRRPDAESVVAARVRDHFAPDDPAWRTRVQANAVALA